MTDIKMIMSVSECLNFLPMAIESDKMPSSSSSLTAMSPEQCWLCGHRLGSICWKNNDWTFPQHSTFSSSSDGQKCWTLWKKNLSKPLWHIWQKHYHKDDLDKDENDGLEKSITCHLWESEHDQSCLRLIWIRFHQSQSSEKGQNTNIVKILHWSLSQGWGWWWAIWIFAKSVGAGRHLYIKWLRGLGNGKDESNSW